MHQQGVDRHIISAGATFFVFCEVDSGTVNISHLSEQYIVCVLSQPKSQVIIIVVSCIMSL